ncbi:MAG: DUF6171 family protein [Lachnospiraceae bacterium]|nr:DUF6171 family protein [Lachnospiraceae bacterium]
MERDARRNEEKLRICRLCDIAAGIPDDIGRYADRLYALLPESERAGGELMDSRLAVCNDCNRNSDGTCLECGCYCVIRSFAVSKHCPVGKW